MAPARLTPHGRSNFRLEIDGLQLAGFAEVTPPGGAASIVYYREGSDRAVARPMRGNLSFDTVTLRRGFDGNAALYEWWQQVRNGDPGARRTVSITLLDQAGQDVARWQLGGAFPTSHRFESLDAMSSEPVIEIVELVYENYELHVTN